MLENKVLRITDWAGQSPMNVRDLRTEVRSTIIKEAFSE